MAIPRTVPKRYHYTFHRNVAPFVEFAFTDQGIDISDETFLLYIDGFPSSPFTMTVNGATVTLEIAVSEANNMERGNYHYHVIHEAPSTGPSALIEGTMAIIE